MIGLLRDFLIILFLHYILVIITFYVMINLKGIKNAN
jgi:hypothetical protein